MGQINPKRSDPYAPSHRTSRAMNAGFSPDIVGRRIGLLTAWASRSGGGVFEAVVAQAALLRTLGAEPVVVALRDRHSAEDAARLAGCDLHHAEVLGPRLIGFAPKLGKLLDAAELDLLHLHGIWMYPSHAAAAWSRRSGKPCLVSPHGMLDPWITRRGRWKKTLARHGYEHRAWRRAAAFHALTVQEAADIGHETARWDSLIVPNAAPPASMVPWAERPPTILYLSRIHLKKNIAALVDAWSRLHAAGQCRPDARLVIAGWGDAPDIAALEHILQAAPPSVEFVGPQFGADKARLLSDARFLVLPSLSEGLPMAILESWAAGTPVLMSSECNLPLGFKQGAALDCGMDSNSIAAALRRALAMGETEWLAMAQAAHRLAAGPFSRGAIARRWQRVYATLIDGRASG